MVLATLIRLEFAYPGVGIFAGDSLQYLSLATAHGVIMVFFMIMPLLFGAFANFLLPTQLGVHDVAFPRLNSAAFWFLPGGLLMLCQLVCVDRRYQRMNCFNIREIQAILKRKFFVDLINTHDHHTLLNKTAVGSRFKLNNSESINSNILIFYNYGLEFAPKIRNNSYFVEMNSFDASNSLKTNSFQFWLINLFLNNFNFYKFNVAGQNFYFHDLTLFFDLNHFFIKNNFFNFAASQVFFFTNDIWSSHFWLSLFKNIPQKIWNIYYYFLNLFSYILTYLLDVSLAIVDYFLQFYFYVLDLYAYYSPYFDYDKICKYWFYSPIYANECFRIAYHHLWTYDPLNFGYQLFEFIVNHPAVYPYYAFFADDISLSPVKWGCDLAWDDIEKALKSIQPKPTVIYNFGTHEEWTNFFQLKLSKLKILKAVLQKLSDRSDFFENLDYSTNMSLVFIVIHYTLTLPSTIKDFYFKSSDDWYDFFVDWISPSPTSQFFWDCAKLTNQSFGDIVLSYFYQTFIVGFRDFFLDLYFFFVHYLPTFTLQDVIAFFYEWFHYALKNVYTEQLSYFFEFFTNVLNFLTTVIFGSQTFPIFNFFYNLPVLKKNMFLVYDSNSYLNYKSSSNYFNDSSLDFIFKNSNEESSANARHLRFSNPVFRYDYKSGDYFPKLYKESYTYMFTTFADLTGGLRTAPWFMSEKFVEAFDTNFLSYFSNASSKISLKHAWSVSRFTAIDGFYNFFYTISNDTIYTNKKWVSIDSLYQKFYKMYATSSMQQRIYSNWRQLKFTREAWRCKLLAARHQKTLFRRYAHEDGVFWSIERNAKDLLPGWAMITPFSARTRFTAVGKTDIGLMGVLLVLNSSIISAANFLVTYRYLSTLNNRKMRDARAFFTEGVMVASWMMVTANPMLVIGIIMLLSDRHWQTSFFDYSGGGDTVLFQHMFWFFGHPEVYIIIIPTFGFTNTMLSYYLKKRVSARASLLYSMYTIAFLGFFVWGHHMYMVGLAHTTRMLFSTLTVMISVPAATKIMHWCVTIVNSAFATELPLLFIITFVFFFVSGGISGMCVAHTGMDVLFHDTFYVIGHFHVMLAGAAMFGSFGAFYFYFPAIFGVKYSRIYAYLHYSYYLLGQLMTVIPMFWLGYAGMPRRVLDYPASLGGWHSIISAGHMLSVAGLMAFFIMIFDSLRQGRAATRNTFGISRYNTRLNFYLYEISRLINAQQKGLFFFRFFRPNSIKLDGFNYQNFEPYETVLISYTFRKIN